MDRADGRVRSALRPADPPEDGVRVPSNPVKAMRAVWMYGLLLLLPVWTVRAQLPADTGRTDPYGTGAGFQILLTNSGFGLGGYYHRSVGRDLRLLFEIGRAHV